MDATFSVLVLFKKVLKEGDFLIIKSLISPQIQYLQFILVEALEAL